MFNNLFEDECCITDDTIMTIAIAAAIMDYGRHRVGIMEYEFRDGADDKITLGDMAIARMRSIGRKYPRCGYGQRFFRWMFSENPEPYGSYGNGAAMRVSAAGSLARSEEEAVEYARAVTEVTHNHPEGLKGAEAVAVAVFMARQGAEKAEIEERMRGYYDIDFRLDDIRESYRSNETCQGSVPQALVAFLEGDSFEDVIRTAISIGGDSDTIAAIAGSIAEAYYGVPKEIEEKALTYLDEELLEIYKMWDAVSRIRLTIAKQRVEEVEK